MLFAPAVEESLRRAGILGGAGDRTFWRAIRCALAEVNWAWPSPKA